MTAHNRREAVEVLAIACMFGLSVCLFLVWSVAFLNGGSTTVQINRFGEMWAEFVMWAALVPVISVGLHRYLRRGEGVEQ